MRTVNMSELYAVYNMVEGRINECSALPSRVLFVQCCEFQCCLKCLFVAMTHVT